MAKKLFSYIDAVLNMLLEHLFSRDYIMCGNKDDTFQI